MPELYEWTVNGATTRETDAMFSRTHEGHTFTPASLKRSGITYGSGLDAAKVNVSVHRTHPVAILFRAMPPDNATLKIYKPRGGTYEAAWSGRLVSVDFAGAGAIISAEPPQTALRLLGLQMSYAERCRHRLGDARCQAPDQSTGGGPKDLSVAAVDGQRIAFAGLADYLAIVEGYRPGQSGRWFVGGEVSFGAKTREAGPRRFVLEQDGDDWLTLSAPFPSVIIGASLNLWVGCSHGIDDCRAKFSNVKNFGGFVFAPKKNPYYQLLSRGRK